MVKEHSNQTDLFDSAVKAAITNDRVVVNKNTQTIMPMDFNSLNKVKNVSPENYKSKNILNPKDDEDRKKYFKVYVDYVSKAMTQVQLAADYNYSITHINRIIKWTAFQIGELDDKAELQTMLDNLKVRKQEILKEKLKVTGDVDKLAKCWKAETQIDRLIATITKLVSPKVLINNDHRSVNYKVGDKLDRRSGFGIDPPKENNEIETEPVKEFAPVVKSAGVTVERGHGNG